MKDTMEHEVVFSKKRDMGILKEILRYGQWVKT